MCVLTVINNIGLLLSLICPYGDSHSLGLSAELMCSQFPTGKIRDVKKV